MATKFRVNTAKNVRATLKIDPASLRKFNNQLMQLKQVTRKAALEKALLAGGQVIHDAAEPRAPGPYIGVEIMTGAELSKKWKSAAAQGIKSDGLYVAIGPDLKHWYYRFEEYGVKPHGVLRRKRTRYQQFASKNKMKRSTLTSYASGKAHRVSNIRPAMVFTIGGQLIFTRKVRGFAAHPFMRPAADSQGNAAVQAVGAVLKDEINKAARS